MRTQSEMEKLSTKIATTTRNIYIFTSIGISTKYLAVTVTDPQWFFLSFPKDFGVAGITYYVTFVNLILFLCMSTLYCADRWSAEANRAIDDIDKPIPAPKDVSDRSRLVRRRLSAKIWAYGRVSFAARVLLWVFTYLLPASVGSLAVFLLHDDGMDFAATVLHRAFQ